MKTYTYYDFQIFRIGSSHNFNQWFHTSIEILNLLVLVPSWSRIVIESLNQTYITIHEELEKHTFVASQFCSLAGGLNEKGNLIPDYPTQKRSFLQTFTCSDEGTTVPSL